MTERWHILRWGGASGLLAALLLTAMMVLGLAAGPDSTELLQPTNDTSGVAAYLQKRGPGLHHICLEVDDIGETIARLKAANIPLIDEEPKDGKDGKRLAFIHPKGTGGVLVELYQYSDPGNDVKSLGK